jgi:putative ABC transport system permease protein
MLSHYLGVALRGFRTAPIATAANAVTLALGLVCFITASAVVGFWKRAEQHFPNAERTVVLTTELSLARAGVATGQRPQSNHYAAQYLKSDFPQIEAVARATLLNAYSAVSDGKDRAIRVYGFGADPEFLRIFDLPFIAGDPRTALSQPHSVILTRDAARRLYGTEDVLGRQIVLGLEWFCTITGVIDSIPEPSHMGRSSSASMPFEMLTSRDIYELAVSTNSGGRDTTQMPENWTWTPNTTYVLLPKDGSLTAKQLAEQLPAFLARHAPPQQVESTNMKLGLVPVDELLELAGGSVGFVRETGLSIATVLLMLGSLVLAIACVNYANLATARAAGRARDVGLRKALGANSRQIMVQHLFEAALLTGIALALALGLIALIVPVLRAESGIDLRVSLLADVGSWLSLLGLLVAVTLAAGAYPAFVLSRVRPVFALRVGRLRIGPRSLSTLLVGTQYAVTSFLLIAVTVTFLQNRELERTGLNTTRDPLLVVENYPVLTNVSSQALRDELRRLPQVRSETGMSVPPWSQQIGTTVFKRSPDPSAALQSTLVYSVGFDFFGTFEIPVLAGRVFDESRPPVFAPGQPREIVIDRALAEQLGFASPKEAVDQPLYPPNFSQSADAPQTAPIVIIGVVENRPLNVTTGTGPTVTAYNFDPGPIFHVLRISAADVSGTLRDIDALWRRRVPAFALNRRFVDEYFNESYANFARINQAFVGLAAFALLISTIGLFAMAVLIASRRAHEIGVRKVLGASTANVVGLLLKSFSKPVVIASVLAWPLAYLAARTYLRSFIDPIALTPAPFVVCLVLTLAIAWSAVGGQTLRAARRKPAAVLRAE